MKLLGTVVLLLALAPTAGAAPQNAARRPNVIVIITDDQGFGDFGFHGNPVVRTPNLDRLARESVELERFYVAPVCAPTRAGLMTGRYYYRTGVTDTYLGRAMMRPEEVTLAEMFAAAGYRTGIFGKWHLGDNYPLRPIDQGFQEALVHKGGGIGQASDPPEGNSYFDPILEHNGRTVKEKGYCSDVFAAAAVKFVEQRRDAPFFVYLAFNAPHAPLEVPDGYYEPYRKMNLANAAFPRAGHPLPREADPDITARIYGMVTNIDDNVGRLLAGVESLGLGANTIVVFLTDNGPQQVRYNAGMFERKGNVHEGGIRVPCLVRWPGKLAAGRKVSTVAAHIDLAPTLLEMTGVAAPRGVAFDGRSLAPVLEGRETAWPDRTLFFQWHRGEVPELYRACAVRTARYKLLQPQGAGDGPLTAKRDFKLYDMLEDPLEQHDISAQHLEIVAKLRAEYEAWFKEMARQGWAPPRIALGTPHENPVMLTRQDWRGPRAGWNTGDLGHWEVNARGGVYDIRLLFPAAAAGATAHFGLGSARMDRPVDPGSKECVFEGVRLPAGPGKLEAWVARAGSTTGVLYVEVKRRPDR
jgi:arylsulfatase A-like enzyme